MPSYNRPSRIPRPPNFILIPLKPNQPPARHAHSKTSQDAAEHHSYQRSRPSSSGNGETEPAASTDYLESSEEQMAGPGDVAYMSAEDGEEAEDFDAEECETEDVRCGWETGG